MAIGEFRTRESGIGAPSSPSFAVVPSGSVMARVLAANVAEAIAVPAGALSTTQWIVTNKIGTWTLT